MLSLQTDNVITRCSSSAVGLSQFAEVIVSSLSLRSVCMAVTSATLNGEINYHWCHLSWHRSQFDHVNQMKGPLDKPVRCNHDLMERIKMHLGYLTIFIRYNCHYVMWTINWLKRSLFNLDKGAGLRHQNQKEINLEGINIGIQLQVKHWKLRKSFKSCC